MGLPREVDTTTRGLYLHPGVGERNGLEPDPSSPLYYNMVSCSNVILDTSFSSSSAGIASTFSPLAR